MKEEVKGVQEAAKNQVEILEERVLKIEEEDVKKMISEYPVYTMLMQLKKDNLLPELLFRTSRRQCDDDIEKLSMRTSAELPRENQELIKAEVEKIIEK